MIFLSNVQTHPPSSRSSLVSERIVDELMGPSADSPPEDDGAISASKHSSFSIRGAHENISRSSPRVKIEESAPKSLSLADRISDDPDVQIVDADTSAGDNLSSMSAELDAARELLMPVVMMSFRRRNSSHRGSDASAVSTPSSANGASDRRSGSANGEAFTQQEQDEKTVARLRMLLTDDVVRDLALHAKSVRQQYTTKERNSSDIAAPRPALVGNGPQHPVPDDDHRHHRARNDNLGDPNTGDGDMRASMAIDGETRDERWTRPTGRDNAYDINDIRPVMDALGRDHTRGRDIGLRSSEGNPWRGGSRDEYDREDERGRRSSDDHFRPRNDSEYSSFRNGSHFSRDTRSTPHRRYSTSPPPRRDTIAFGPGAFGKRRERDWDVHGSPHSYDRTKLQRNSARARSHDHTSDYGHSLRERLGSPIPLDEHSSRKFGREGRGKDDYRSEKREDGYFGHKQWRRNSQSSAVLQSPDAHPSNQDKSSAMTMVGDLVNTTLDSESSHKDTEMLSERHSDRGSPLPPGLQAAKLPPNTPKAHGDPTIAAADHFLASMERDLAPSAALLAAKTSTTSMSPPNTNSLPPAWDRSANMFQGNGHYHTPARLYEDSPAQTTRQAVPPSLFPVSRSENGNGEQAFAGRISPSVLHPRGPRPRTSSINTQHDADHLNTNSSYRVSNGSPDARGHDWDPRRRSRAESLDDASVQANDRAHHQTRTSSARFEYNSNSTAYMRSSSERKLSGSYPSSAQNKDTATSEDRRLSSSIAMNSPPTDARRAAMPMQDSSPSRHSRPGVDSTLR